MVYSVQYSKSARRHFAAAELLNHAVDRSVQRGGVDGYLYGIAAECALKQIMRNSGMTPDPKSRKGDPFYAHFPDLKTLIGDNARGRRSGELRAFSDDPRLMAQWSMDMRYALVGDILDRLVQQWKDDAHKLIDLMG